MKVFFLINEARGAAIGSTTAVLIGEAVRQGHETWVSGVAELGIDAEGEVVARARRMTVERGEEVLAALASNGSRTVRLSGMDRVLIRTNPARDTRRWAHETALLMLRRVRDAGIPVINDPDALMRSGGKLYLAGVDPAYRPRFVVSRRIPDLLAFLEAEGGPCVVKPLDGTHGRDVFLIEYGTSGNVKAIMDVVTRSGYAMIQEYVPEARDGDVRLIVLDGELLEVDGRAASVRRIPAEGEFRSNVHLGGNPAPIAPSEAMRGAVRSVGPLLVRDGIRLAGLDFIGGKLVEVNVYSTGGLPEAGAFNGVDYCQAVVARLLG